MFPRGIARKWWCGWIGRLISLVMLGGGPGPVSMYHQPISRLSTALANVFPLPGEASHWEGEGKCYVNVSHIGSENPKLVGDLKEQYHESQISVYLEGHPQSTRLLSLSPEFLKMCWGRKE